MAGSLIPNMEVNIGSSSGVDSYLKAIAGLSNAMEAPFERAREKDKLEKEQERYNAELGFKQRSEQRDLDKINMENKSKDALLNYNNNIARATTLGTMTDKQNSDLGNEFTNLVSSGKSEDEAARIITNKANEFATADTKRLAESPSERANRISQLEISGEGIDPTKLIDLKNQNVRDLRAEQNNLDDNAFREKQFEEQKKQHNESVRQANQSYALQKQRYDYEINKDKKAEQEKIADLIAQQNIDRNSSGINPVGQDIDVKTGNKTFSKEDKLSLDSSVQNFKNTDENIKSLQEKVNQGETLKKTYGIADDKNAVDDLFLKQKSFKTDPSTIVELQNRIKQLEGNTKEGPFGNYYETVQFNDGGVGTRQLSKSEKDKFKLERERNGTDTELNIARSQLKLLSPTITREEFGAELSKLKSYGSDLANKSNKNIEDRVSGFTKNESLKYKQDTEETKKQTKFLTPYEVGQKAQEDTINDMKKSGNFNETQILQAGLKSSAKAAKDQEAKLESYTNKTLASIEKNRKLNETKNDNEFKRLEAVAKAAENNYKASISEDSVANSDKKKEAFNIMMESLTSLAEYDFNK